MVGDIRPYPAYKDSGVVWLGEVPSSWGVSKVKHLSPFQVGWTPPTRNDENFNGDNLWANISDLGNKTICDTAKRISDYAAKVASMDITPMGSLLYSFKLSVGSVSFAGRDMYTNEAIASFLEVGKLPLSYLYFALPKFIIENASTNIYGARILNQELIKNAILLAPPYEEAEAIANFLDHETTKIDTLIDKQQQLIKLLKEKRQAVISHAVTKGLNLDAPMKDSGVEWLGEVPEHWAMMKFSHCASIRNGQVDPRHHPYNKFILIAPNHVESGTGKIISIETAEEQGADSGKYLCKTGEVIYSKIRPALAKACIAPSDNTICSADMYPIAGRNGLKTQFLFWFVLSQEFTSFAVLESDRVAMPKINRESLADIKIPVPPEIEQESLVRHIQAQMEKFDVLVLKAESAIALLKERRTALISAAVTGKIDVRNWQSEHVEYRMEASA